MRNNNMSGECDQCGEHALDCRCLPESKTIVAEMCECGRLYKDRINKTGKMMCSACYNGCSVDGLKILWGTPVYVIKPHIKDEKLHRKCVKITQKSEDLSVMKDDKI